MSDLQALRAEIKQLGELLPTAPAEPAARRAPAKPRRTPPSKGRRR